MRPMRRLLALLAAVVLVLGAPNPAHADPDPDGSGANGTLQDQFAATAKAYADAKSKLDTALARQEQFRAQLAASNARIVELSDQVGLLAAAVYRSGPASTFAVMLDSTSPDELVERAEALRQLSRTEDRQRRGLPAALHPAHQRPAALGQEVAGPNTQT